MKNERNEKQEVSQEPEETKNQRLLEEYKRKFGEVYLLEIPTDEKVLTAYLKTPSRKAIEASMSFANSQPLTANEIILNDAWISGDEEIRKIEKNLIAALMSLDGLIEIKRGNLKKL